MQSIVKSNWVDVMLHYAGSFVVAFYDQWKQGHSQLR